MREEEAKQKEKYQVRFQIGEKPKHVSEIQGQMSFVGVGLEEEFRRKAGGKEEKKGKKPEQKSWSSASDHQNGMTLTEMIF